MNLTTLSRVVLALAAVMIAGSVQAQQVTAYSPGRGFDQYSWALFVQVVKPAASPNLNGPLTFETWATDEDTFDTTPPVWPTAQIAAAHNEQHRFQASALGLARAHLPNGLQGALPNQNGVAATCVQPQNAAAGNYPTPFVQSPPTNCIAEEVRRNLDSFNFIVGNGLYSQAGLQKAFTNPNLITFPKPAIEIKIDWAPVNTVVAWLNQNGVTVNGQPVTTGFVMRNYYVIAQNGTQYAFLSMHISSKDRPNWHWATFEHQMNPGRCDTMGCYDLFGVPTAISYIAPKQTANTQYPACAKSPALSTMFARSGLSRVWDNYCLKDSQIDYLSNQSPTQGQALLDGDSVIERITANVPIAQSSCITCHAYATFGADGCVFFKTNPGLGSPAPVGTVNPQAGQKMYDFVWGLIAIKFANACFSE